MTPREAVEARIKASDRADAQARASLYPESAINHQAVRGPVLGRNPKGLGCCFFQIIDDKIAFQPGDWDEGAFGRLQGLGPCP